MSRGRVANDARIRGPGRFNSFLGLVLCTLLHPIQNIKQKNGPDFSDPETKARGVKRGTR